MRTIRRSLLVGLIAVVLSTLALQASDSLRGIDTRFTGLVFDSDSPCGIGAVQVLLGSHALCVDVYEASPSEKCPVSVPNNQSETQTNMNSIDCVATSVPGVRPWTNIALTQAQQVCARTGKRLPTNEEWYKFASGIVDQSACIVDYGSSPTLTGSSECVTPAGIHDVVGNVWEWVDEEVVNGQYAGRTLPESGYVSLVDSDGVVLETTDSAQVAFDNDYAWTKPQGVYGVIRGGFYGSGDDAGIFAQNLAVPLDFRTAGVGFRCVRDI